MNLQASLNANIAKSRDVNDLRSSLRGMPTRIVAELRAWRIRREYRRDLRRLLEIGPHLVIDMGIGVDEARHEISKPFYVA
jgi:uncharacterized protein YjiS (DUF1127 family)